MRGNEGVGIGRYTIVHLHDTLQYIGCVGSFVLNRKREPETAKALNFKCTMQLLNWKHRTQRCTEISSFPKMRRNRQFLKDALNHVKVPEGYSTLFIQKVNLGHKFVLQRGGVTKREQLCGIFDCEWQRLIFFRRILSSRPSANFAILPIVVGDCSATI